MRKDDIVEDYHGTLVEDPYRWLEDNLSPETQAWLGEQNDITRDFLDTPLREQIKQRLTELWNFPKYELPKEAGGRLFFLKNDGLQNQPLLYVQDPGQQPVEILDPNSFSDDGTVALTRFGVSNDGKLLAYATSVGGSDWQSIRIRHVDSGEEFPETINWCRFTNLPWTPDGKGFFYSRFPQPGAVPPEEQGNYCQVCYHRVGTDQQQDEVVYQRPDAKELGFMPFISEDGKYLALVVTHGTASRNRFYYRPLHSKGAFVRLLDEGDAAYRPAGNIGTKFYFRTDLDAPRGRVIAIDIDKPERQHWQEVISQGEDTMDSAQLIGGKLVVVYKHHAHHKIQLYSVEGQNRGGIKLPGMGSVSGIFGKIDSQRMFIGYMSHLYPPTVFSYDFGQAKLEPFGETASSFEPRDYETTQVFYQSKDGTQVPMFVTHKKGIALDGSNPTVLFGYGGFNISMTPSFSPAHLMFIERGGVYAAACLRGGSEYGEEWHRAGMLENKQNVFDDFIAAAEWLVANNYTSSKRLAIMGRSNGGLLVSACMTQRPDLYSAVICWVPVVDMLRYHKFTIGRYWVPEYGNAEENPEHFKFMYAYSPLHNVRQDVEYPPTLVMTADTDDRVIPGHALKFAATLQEKYQGGNPILLRVEMKAGHGPGKPIGKLIDEAADQYTFLYNIWDG